MTNFREFLLEEINPPIHKIIKDTIKKSGFSKDANCSGGRCYEFRDSLHDALIQHGYKPLKTESRDWIRHHAKKLGKKVGYAESAALEDHNHAWVVVNGKHYDSLDHHGISSPKEMTFFKDHIDKFRPDDEMHHYMKSKGKKYNHKKDIFE